MDNGLRDFQINQKVKAILENYQIELGELFFSSRGGVVYIEGAIKNRDQKQTASAKTMRGIDEGLREIEGVRSVRYHLFNLDRTQSGQWKKPGPSASPKKKVWKFQKLRT